MPDPDPTPTPTPDPTPDPTPAPGPTPSPDDDAYDKDRAMATITKLRQAEKDGKAAARERDDLAARLKAIEDGEKSDLQKAQDRAAELEQQQTDWQAERRETNLKLAVYAKQASLGIVDADLALVALDRKAIEYDDKGEPTNVEAQLTALLEQKPILKGTPAPAPTPDINGGSGAQGGPPPALTAEELAAAKQHDMTPEKYALVKNAPKTGPGGATDIIALAAQRRQAQAASQ